MERNKLTHTRGFVFFLDALFASTIALLVIALVAQISLTSSLQEHKMLTLQYCAQDILTVLDKDYTLKSAFASPTPASLINSSVASLLPARMNAEGNVTLCDYNSRTETFSCTYHSFKTSQENSSSANLRGSARRVFTDMSNMKYGVVSLRTWFN
ncbi:MAG: hypothetical protein ABIH99_01865 [Candidatus Micrarchaeota archaeon]